MTAFPNRTIRQAGFAAAVAVAFLALALTSGFAFSAEAQQMCTGDAFRLCSSEIPDIPAMTACMYKHRANLSPGLPDGDGPRSGRAEAKGRGEVILHFVIPG
jgi:hypothetical protein